MKLYQKLWLMTAAVFVFSACNAPTAGGTSEAAPSDVLSTAQYADILGSNRYQMVVEKAGSSPDSKVEITYTRERFASAASYTLDGTAIKGIATDTEVVITADGQLTEDTAATALLEKNDVGFSPRFDNLTATGAGGGETVGDQSLTYEEYSYGSRLTPKSLRIYLDGNTLYGIAYQDGAVERILSLTGEIPADAFDTTGLRAKYNGELVISAVAADPTGCSARDIPYVTDQQRIAEILSGILGSETTLVESGVTDILTLTTEKGSYTLQYNRANHPDLENYHFLGGG